MQWIPCSVTECSGFDAAWLNGSRLNAVDSMLRGPMDLERMQWIPCSVVQWIWIERSGFHASWRNASQLNAVNFMQHGPKGQQQQQKKPHEGKRFLFCSGPWPCCIDLC